MNVKLSCTITCASLNYQRLDDAALANLKSAEMRGDSEFLKEFASALGFRVESIALIQKCNAVIVVMTYNDDLSQDFVRGRLLSTWDKYSHAGITNFARDIKFIYDAEALQYLGECAMGVHSVTIGDSQVLSQVEEELRNGYALAQNPLLTIADWILTLGEECRLRTDIFKGNTSLERIACELIVKKNPHHKPIVLVGYGKTGKLVAKILNKENGYPLVIVNRTPVHVASEGFGKDVTYTPFEQFTGRSDAVAFVNAISHSAKTLPLVQSLIKKVNADQTVFVDLSSPSLLAEAKVENPTDIKELSQIAEKTASARKNEVNKVRTLISRQLQIIVNRLNETGARLYIQEQRGVKFRISDETHELIEERSKMLANIRSFLNGKGFSEIMTPYIVGVSTDPPKVDKGGTIDVDWFNSSHAFLRQSNQIYKQICVVSGMKKIYEIGPFWRKEESETYRHLQESIGLDVEMQKPENLEQLYKTACSIIKDAKDNLVAGFDIENHLQLPDIDAIPVLTYNEAVDLLRENGNPVTRGDDFGLVSEAKLGHLIKRMYASDIFVIRDYPDTIKKFYTKDKANGLTETFDVIVDGWELVSGAIRQTDGSKIRKSMQLSGINISDYEFYISVVDGAVPHGGFCIGLDRLLAKILNKEMVSQAVPFPRTYKKLIP
jgi:aspartyl/asparaginyl-tRNA synthetase